MANYVIKWRTNYFRVKNIEEFEKAIAPISCELYKNRDENGNISTICLTDTGEGEIDYFTYYNEEKDEFCEFDWVEIAYEHLQDEEVIVFNMIGSEKLRYLTGRAEAFTYDGKCYTITFDDLYKELGERGYTNVTDCSY